MYEKLNTFLEPSAESKEVVRAYAEMQQVRGRNFRRADMGPTFFRAKEKPLEVREWLVHGANQKGSHFPICVFSNNRGSRSPQRKIERSHASSERLKKKIEERRSSGGESADPSAAEGWAEHESWAHPPVEGWTWNSTWGGEGGGAWEHWNVTWWRNPQ